MRSASLIATLALLLGGCAEVQFLAQGYKHVSGSADGVVEGGEYVVGNAWVASAPRGRDSGTYHYPSEDFTLDQTGLAVAYDGPPPRARFTARRTANNEPFDPARLTVAHQTLQLPAIARVTNLENGRAVVVRVNDRGPADPGRMLGLSRATAQALGVAPGQPARVRLQVLETESRNLAAALRAAPPPALAGPAPETRLVAAEALAPPSGVQGATRVRTAPAAPTPLAAAIPSAAPPVPVGTRTQDRPRATMLAVQAGSFASAENARRFEARLYGIAPGRVRTEPVSSGGRWFYRVRIGPVQNTAEADRMLREARAAGAADARIVVVE
jgi:rare lipoprotein A